MSFPKVLVMSAVIILMMILICLFGATTNNTGSLFRDVAAGVAAAASACVAWEGLSNWKREHQSDVGHEEAKKLLHSVEILLYELKMLGNLLNMYSERSLMILSNDTGEHALDFRKAKMFSQKELYKPQKAKVDKALVDLRYAGIEAKILFGEKIGTNIEKIVKNIREIPPVFDSYFELVASVVEGRAKPNYVVFCNMLSYSNNPKCFFWKEIDSAAGDIWNIAGPYLSLKSSKTSGKPRFRRGWFAKQLSSRIGTSIRVPFITRQTSNKNES